MVRNVRKPVVAGQFYPFSKEVLKGEIEKFLNKVKEEKEENFCGFIVPHAGYMFSAFCASHAYKKLLHHFPSNFIIIGPNHTGYGTSEFALTFKDFETPFGLAKNNKELGKKLLKLTSVDEDDVAHRYEHSIEVQLPFLQFIAEKLGKNFKFVPIVVSTNNLEKSICFGKQLGKFLKSKNACIIASSDFTHYGIAYNFLPFPPSKDIGRKIYSIDKEAIEKILKLDSKGFYKEATKTTICGITPIVIAIEACKELGSRKARLLYYSTSADVINDYSTAVGYASIVFE